MSVISARIETPTADARPSSASDGGKGRTGQGKGDAFGGLLAEIGGTKAAVDTDSAGTLAMNTTSVVLPGAAATGKMADGVTSDVALPSLSGRLFQSLVEGTAGAEIQAKADTAEDDTKPARARDLDSDPAIAAMLAMSALAANLVPAAASVRTASLSTNASSAPPATVASGSKGAASLVASIAAGAAETDEPVTSAATGDMSSISDVSVETHIAVAASSSVPSGEAGDAAHQAETKLEPALSADALQAMAAPTRTVAQAVDALLPQSATPAQPADPAPPSLAPARTMTLQLNPADLGTVHVRLHLTGQALDLQLSVSSKETLGVISRDRTHLETALAGQSYDLRSLVIQGADGASAMGDPQAGANGQGAATQGGQSDGGQNRSTSTSGNGAGGSGNGSGGERRSTQTRGYSTDEAARASGASRDGALFV